MSENTLGLLAGMSWFFGPLLLLGALSFWAMFRFWRPIAQELNVSFFNRSVSHKVLFAGIIGGSPELQKRVKKYRCAYAGILAVFFAFVLIFLSWEGFIFLLFFLALSVLISRPFEVEGDQP